MKTNKSTQNQSTTIADALDTPTPEAVAQRAYENYEREGSQHGSDVEHWLAAESELLAERENF